MKTTYPHISRDGSTVTIEARTMADADAAAHEALGPGWSTKSVRRLRKGGVGGFFAIEVVELVAVPAARAGAGTGDGELASAEDLLRELTHTGGAFATRLIDRLAEPLDDEMTIARLLATTDGASRPDEMARVMSQLGFDRQTTADLAALPDAPTFTDHAGSLRTAELPVLDGECADELASDLFRPTVVAPLLVVPATGPVGTIEAIASNGGRLVSTADLTPSNVGRERDAIVDAEPIVDDAEPAAGDVERVIDDAPPPSIDDAPAPSIVHAPLSPVPPAPPAPLAPSAPPAPSAPQPPPAAPPPSLAAPPPPPPAPTVTGAPVAPLAFTNPLLAPPTIGMAAVTEPIVKALGEPAVPLDVLVAAPITGDDARRAIDTDLVIALALGAPTEIDAAIPDELPHFEDVPANVAMDLPLAKINPFVEPLATIVDAPDENAPITDGTLDDVVESTTATAPTPAIEIVVPRLSVSRRPSRHDATLRDLAAAASSSRTSARRDVLFGRRPSARTAPPSGDLDVDVVADRVPTAAPAEQRAEPQQPQQPQQPYEPPQHDERPQPEPHPEPQPTTFRTMLSPRPAAETSIHADVSSSPIGSGWSAPALRALGLPEGMVAAAAALAPRDDAEWTAALMLACRDRFDAVPATPMLMAGPQLAAMANALRLPLVEPGDPTPAAYVALETDDPDEVLATLDGRALHLVVGGSWQELARLRPVVVSAAGPRFMLQALSVAHAWGVPLGWMGGVESVRLDAVTLALEIRSALGFDLEEVRHRTS